MTCECGRKAYFRTAGKLLCEECVKCPTLVEVPYGWLDTPLDKLETEAEWQKHFLEMRAGDPLVLVATIPNPTPREAFLMRKSFLDAEEAQ